MSHEKEKNKGIGDNGGPPLVPLTAKTKLECVKQLLERIDITAAQKCIGAMMIVQADREWSAEMKTEELKIAASAKDRETVFRATRALDQKGIISKASGRGQSGRYHVLPPRIVEAVVEAYESGRVDADQSNAKWSGETGRHKQSVPTTKPVGFDQTSPVEPVRFEPTSREKPDHSPSRVLDNNINNLTKTNTSLSSHNTFTEAARENALTGEQLKTLGDVLTGACNGALDNPVNCLGLASLATPIMWINEGCDLDADILPTLRGFGVTLHGKRIRSWGYFTKAIQEARDARLKGMPTGSAPTRGRASKHVQRPDGKSFMDLTNEMLSEFDKGAKR